MNLLKEYYATEIDNSEIDLLIGNGFTKAFKTKNFDYNEFAKELYEGIEAEKKILEEMPFYKSVFKTDKVDDIEEYIYLLKVLKGLSYKIISPEQEQSIDKIYNKVYLKFEEEFSDNSNKQKQFKEYEVNPAIVNIYSTNYIPDFNFLLLKEDLPRNFLDEKNNKFFPREKCINKENCLECAIGETSRPSCSLGANHARVFSLHGGLNVWYQESSKTKDTYLYKTTVRSKVDSLYNMLLITDGSGEAKVERINEHEYTRLAFKVFKASTNDIIIFGNKLTSVDSHIVEVLKSKIKSNNATIYISIYGESEQEKTDEIARMLLEFDLGSRDNIKFIDSEYIKNYILQKKN